MSAAFESALDEVAWLRGCLNDLVSIMALPRLWTDGDPVRIATTLQDALIEVLEAAFVLVRVNDVDGGPVFEMVRVADSFAPAGTRTNPGDTIMTLLDRSRPGPANPRVSVGDVELWTASAALGLQGELGEIIVGWQRSGVPEQTAQLLLDVAASQAAIGLQQARLLGEQRRRADELDLRVAVRTSELTAANAALMQEVEDRRRAEDAVRRAERDARLIVDSIPGLVALLSATGDVQFVNRRLLEYFGQTLEELKQWGTRDTVHPDDLPHVIDAFSRAITSGSAYTIVQRFRRSDGMYRWFENSGFPLHDESGRVVRWCVLLTDIDERKRAEDGLAASERNLQLTIDTIPALAWSARPDGSADFFNRHYLEFVGLSTEQASGWGWAAAVHPEDLASLAATWEEIRASAASGEAEARLRRSDGEYRWLLFRTSPLRDETGDIVKWYGVNTDIEDRKRAEEELRRAYDSFADAQRLSHTGSFITDLVGDDHNWSEETYRIFGFDPATQITVQRIRDSIHPDDLLAFDAMIARALTGVDISFAYRILAPPDGVKHVRGVAHVVERVEGRPMFVGAIQDVTESAVAEEALHRARSELAHVARVSAVSTLTASIAHEVSQPLSGIITNAGTCLRMLEADPPNIDGARETARRTIRDGNRASDVLGRLRTLFSRREFTLEPTDLNDLTREVLVLSSSDLQRHRVTLRSELADAIPSVLGDRVQLQQVLLNLLINAAEAMSAVTDRARELTIRTAREGNDHVRVTVRDTGVGIEPESTSRVFDAFYSTKSGGMGIGLSVSRSIVERHHGRLWVEPNDGPGTTFVFVIPCQVATAAAESTIPKYHGYSPTAGTS